MLKFLFAFVLTFGFQALSISNALAESEAKYDPFSDETTIEMTSTHSQERPSMSASAKFQGKSINSSKTIEFGFISAQTCPKPKFIADGYRVGPKADPSSLADLLMGSAYNNVPGKTFNFDFFTLRELLIIANAKNVKFKLCKEVYTMTSQEKNELKIFIALFKTKP